MADKAHPLEDCQSCFCSALRRASRAVTQHYDTSLRGTGLRTTQFTLLATLAQIGPLPMNRLAAMLGLDRTTLTRNLKPLARRDLVRVTGDSDRRVRQVEITPEGEAAAYAAHAAWRRAQSTAGEVIGRSGLSHLLGRVQA